jgi:NAD+ kinase
MKNIAIIPNPNKDKELNITRRVAKELMEMGFSVQMEERYSDFPIDGVSYSATATGSSELIIVVGGDGSIIDASPYAVAYDIPILGINLGKVGYLTEVEPNETSVLSKVLTGEYKIEEKMLLMAEKYTADGKCEAASRLAVNDVIISHGTVSVAELSVENSKGDLVRYRADGVIVATPIGSTAYSLSAGGPIISHTLDSITVTPVCPHSFFNRAIVYGPEEKIKISKSVENDIRISFSSKYMMEALKSFQTDEIELHFVGEIKPILIKSEDDESLTQLVLPIRTY